MKKNKQRNELSIFEELRLKPSKNEIWSSEDPPESSPREEDLKELNILCKVGKDNNPISWWKKRPNGEFMQVNEFGEVIFSGDKRYEKTIPKSIEFCSRAGLNYVSCSPYRVPIARLAAAQAELKNI